MVMKYDEALKVWGLKKLEEAYPKVHYGWTFHLSTVKVLMDFDEGSNCCGGPDCYCSPAESPSANVLISAVLRDVNDVERIVVTKIPYFQFDFATVLQEIVEAGGGEISTE